MDDNWQKNAHARRPISMKVTWLFLEGWVVVYLPLRILDSYQWENNLFNCLSFIVIIIYIMYVCIILKIFDCWKKSYLLAKITEYFTWCRVLAATEIFCVTYIGSRLQDCTVNDLGWWHNLGKIFIRQNVKRCNYFEPWGKVGDVPLLPPGIQLI